MVRPAYSPGLVGVMSRSGGMATKSASMLTQARIGQSTCVSIGGDSMVGSTLVIVRRQFMANKAVPCSAENPLYACSTGLPS